MSAVRGWGRWEGRRGSFYLTVATTHQFEGVFSPSFPERQLSNSFKCVKPSLHFRTGCNTWVLNKEEQINVWPSLRVPHLRVKDDRSGDPALTADRCSCSWGDSHMNHGFGGCCLPSSGLGKSGT